MDERMKHCVNDLRNLLASRDRDNVWKCIINEKSYVWYDNDGSTVDNNGYNVTFGCINHRLNVACVAFDQCCVCVYDTSDNPCSLRGKWEFSHIVSHMVLLESHSGAALVSVALVDGSMCLIDPSRSAGSDCVSMQYLPAPATCMFAHESRVLVGGRHGNVYDVQQSSDAQEPLLVLSCADDSKITSIYAVGDSCTMVGNEHGVLSVFVGGQLIANCRCLSAVAITDIRACRVSQNEYHVYIVQSSCLVSSNRGRRLLPRKTDVSFAIVRDNVCEMVASMDVSRFIRQNMTSAKDVGALMLQNASCVARRENDDDGVALMSSVVYMVLVSTQCDSPNVVAVLWPQHNNHHHQQQQQQQQLGVQLYPMAPSGTVIGCGELLLVPPLRVRGEHVDYHQQFLPSIQGSGVDVTLMTHHGYERMTHQSFRDALLRLLCMHAPVVFSGRMETNLLYRVLQLAGFPIVGGSGGGGSAGSGGLDTMHTAVQVMLNASLSGVLANAMGESFVNPSTMFREWVFSSPGTYVKSLQVFLRRTRAECVDGTRAIAVEDSLAPIQGHVTILSHMIATRGMESPMEKQCCVLLAELKCFHLQLRVAHWLHTSQHDLFTLVNDFVSNRVGGRGHSRTKWQKQFQRLRYIKHRVIHDARILSDEATIDELFIDTMVRIADAPSVYPMDALSSFLQLLCAQPPFEYTTPDEYDRAVLSCMTHRLYVWFYFMLDVDSVVVAASAPREYAREFGAAFRIDPHFQRVLRGLWMCDHVQVVSSDDDVHIEDASGRRTPTLEQIQESDCLVQLSTACEYLHDNVVADWHSTHSWGKRILTTFFAFESYTCALRFMRFVITELELRATSREGGFDSHDIVLFVKVLLHNRLWQEALVFQRSSCGNSLETLGALLPPFFQWFIKHGCVSELLALPLSQVEQMCLVWFLKHQINCLDTERASKYLRVLVMYYIVRRQYVLATTVYTHEMNRLRRINAVALQNDVLELGPLLESYGALLCRSSLKPVASNSREFDLIHKIVPHLEHSAKRLNNEDSSSQERVSGSTQHDDDLHGHDNDETMMEEETTPLDQPPPSTPVVVPIATPQKRRVMVSQSSPARPYTSSPALSGRAGTPKAAVTSFSQTRADPQFWATRPSPKLARRSPHLLARSTVDVRQTHKDGTAPESSVVGGTTESTSTIRNENNVRTESPKPTLNVSKPDDSNLVRLGIVQKASRPVLPGSDAHYRSVAQTPVRASTPLASRAASQRTANTSRKLRRSTRRSVTQSAQPLRRSSRIKELQKRKAKQKKKL